MIPFLDLKDKRREIKKFLRSKFLFLKLKLKILLGYKLRVCFFVQETQKWNAQSLYDKMAKSDIFEPFMLVSPLEGGNAHRNSYQHCVEFFKNRCNNVELGYDESTKSYIDIKEFNPDIVFFQQPWNLHATQNAIYSSKFALCYYFSYAMGDSPNLAVQLSSQFHIALRKFFIFSQAELDLLLEYGYKYSNLSIIGHPKLDIYNRYKPHKNPKTLIIYALHHSLEPNSLNYATFPWSGKYMLEWAKSHPEFKWLFKPHPRLKVTLILQKIMTPQEVDEYYNEWAQLGECYDDGDYFDIFMNSKCLITDCGSFLTEYLPTQQPVIHLRNPKAQHYTATNKLIMDSYYKAYNTIELEEWLDRILIKQEDPKKSERLDILRTLDIKTSASDKIIDEIKKDLSL